jgi:porphobilinogen synthase
MAFPATRLRRLRRTPALRAMVRETAVAVDDLMMPLFIVPGSGVRREIPSLPGLYQLSIDQAAAEAREIRELGIPSVLLFAIPESKDECGSAASKHNGIIQRAIGEIKKSAPGLLVVTDLCFCEYTSHGHCGIIKEHDVDNDATLTIIGEQALSHAEAGADLIAPSGMMDGAVGAIRGMLDEHDFSGVPIMAYAAKYASAFYGPFREAVQSAPEFGDRRSYQMDPANVAEALREVELDIEEGADIVMVKPAMAYLDVVRRVKDTFGLPTAAYNVSGEYAMVKAAAARGWIDERRVMLETLTSIKRAGADILITYFAKDFAKLAKNGAIE